MPSAAHPSRFRLAPDVRPSDYHVHLEPDLAAGRFRGEVRIDVRLARSRTEIVLHAADLTIEHADAEVDGQVVPLRVVLVRNGDQVMYSQIHSVPATISEGQASVLWTQVVDGVTVPAAESSGRFVIYVGFDEGEKTGA